MCIFHLTDDFIIKILIRKATTSNMRGIPHLKSRWKMPKSQYNVESPHHFNILFLRVHLNVKKGTGPALFMTSTSNTKNARHPTLKIPPDTRHANKELYFKHFPKMTRYYYYWKIIFFILHIAVKDIASIFRFDEQTVSQSHLYYLPCT